MGRIVGLEFNDSDEIIVTEDGEPKVEPEVDPEAVEKKGSK